MLDILKRSYNREEFPKAEKEFYFAPEVRRKKEVRFRSKQINLECKKLKEAEKKENEFCGKEDGQVLQIVQDIKTDVTSIEILISTPNDTVSLNCSGYVRKMSVVESIQLEQQAI